MCEENARFIKTDRGKKIMRSAVGIIICLSTILTLFSKAIYADEISGYSANMNGDIIQCDIEDSSILRVNEVCGGLPYHKMIARGTGTVYLSNGSLYLKNKPCWQCANCNLVMVTEGDIYLGEMSVIGKWAICPWPEPLTSLFVIIQPPSSTGTCNSNKMNGYKFFLYTG